MLLIVHTVALLLNQSFRICVTVAVSTLTPFLCVLQTSTSAAPSRVCVTEENAPTRPAATFATVPEVTSPARTDPDVWVSRVGAWGGVGRLLTSIPGCRKSRINF